MATQVVSNAGGDDGCSLLWIWKCVAVSPPLSGGSKYSDLHYALTLRVLSRRTPIIEYLRSLALLRD